MTLNEFLTLKEGDRVESMTRTRGTVIGVTHDRRGEQEGVLLEWDGTSPDAARAFTKHSTIWMHWSKIADCTYGITD